MLRNYFFCILCLIIAVTDIHAQLLSDTKLPKSPLSLYEGYREDRVHGYVPKEAIPDRYPICLAGFVMPLDEVVVTSAYGVRGNRMHCGIDLALETGDTIRSAFDGYIRKSGYDTGGYGYYLVVRHNNGLETVYGHLKDYILKDGAEVKAGEPIALGGNSGRSTGPHLHFETLFMGQAINPRLLIDFAEKRVHHTVYYYTQGRLVKPVKMQGKRKIKCHRVQDGETLELISKKYAVTVDELCRYNHLNRNSKLRAGQILRYT